ncbi:hypothetical protein LTR36_010830 [Oleoguttula mirabilis]|uniref:Uncharacterized protein n=1 Tax=Oleoguttula mirabilis TaxID=1507867 RepID=A0AAV9J3U2_9PEZI|nr:hypothetical protein LTR36_010830 [Oleoguttula mirabilis]
MVNFAEDAAARHNQLFLGAQQNVVNAHNDLLNLLNGAPAAAGPPALPPAALAEVRALAQNRLTAEQVELGIVGAARLRLQTDADFPPVPQRPLPPLSDGLFKMLESTLSRARKVARLAQGRINFRMVPPNAGLPPGSWWVGTWPMGQGGMSTTGLLVQCDQNWLVNDRVFKKETHLSRLAWGSATHFDGDVRNAANRRPLEWTCHDAMLGVLGRSTRSPLVPGLRATTIDDMRREHTMFMEFCPFTDLATVIGNYRGIGG